MGRGTRAVAAAVAALLALTPAAATAKRHRQAGHPYPPSSVGPKPKGFKPTPPPPITNADRCDPFDTSVCLYPFPNDYFTRPDPSTDTKLRLNLNLLSMPRNVANHPIDPTDFNRNDGFSPGNLIALHVPGLDNPTAFRKTHAVPITDVARSYDRKQPIVVINARTGRRQLIYSEVDRSPNDDPSNPNNVALIIRPAANFEEGGHYVVALRNLRDRNGHGLKAPAAFTTYRDSRKTSNPTIEGRRARMEWIFRTLGKAGVARKNLYLAWDFTVASRRNLSERMLHIRDDAFAQLGDHNLRDLKVQGSSPTFQVTKTTDFSPCSAGNSPACEDGESNKIVREIEGRVFVPCYLNGPACQSGQEFLYGSDGVPQQIPGNVDPANFDCIVPRSAVGPGGAVHPARPSLYGHGLLGTASQVSGKAIEALAVEHDIVLCASDWIGMAQEDIPNDVGILSDVSRMGTLADRAQQGMLNFLYLGRAMIHPQGFVTNAAFRINGKPVIDTRRLYYDGGSQGGIMGGGLTAVAPDFTRASLGVPGMNYSTLLQRSVDFDEYAVVLYNSYRNPIERQLIFSLVQLLWDRAEADGYAHHINGNPLPNTPSHRVILDMAYGDHQVTNWATEVEARTIGARMRRPALVRSRVEERQPFYAIPRIRRYPVRNASLFEVWDVGPLRKVKGEEKGTPKPPTANVPNREGVDPHGPDASEQPSARTQISNFLRPDGVITPVCGRHACFLDGWLGPGTGS